MIPILIVVVQIVPQQVTPADHVAIHTARMSHMIAQMIRKKKVQVQVIIITAQIVSSHSLQ